MCPKIRTTACILYLLGDTRVFSRYSSKACGKTFIKKKNTWNIFQYSALFETFRTCNIFPFFTKSVFFWKLCKLFQKKNKNTSYTPLLNNGKITGKVRNFFEKGILSYLKLFGLAIFSRYSSKACGKTFLKKKNLENFSVFCPIWNFSDLQYFSFIHQKQYFVFIKGR